MGGEIKLEEGTWFMQGVQQGGKGAINRWMGTQGCGGGSWWASIGRGLHLCQSPNEVVSGVATGMQSHTRRVFYCKPVKVKSTHLL